MTSAYQSYLTPEVITKFDIKDHMTLDMLVSNLYDLFTFLEHLEGRPHILCLLPECVPPQGVPILLVYYNGFFDCVRHADPVLMSLEPMPLRL